MRDCARTERPTVLDPRVLNITDNQLKLSGELTAPEWQVIISRERESGLTVSRSTTQGARLGDNWNEVLPLD